jgi:hypothetical protein
VLSEGKTVRSPLQLIEDAVQSILSSSPWTRSRRERMRASIRRIQSVFLFMRSVAEKTGKAAFPV